MDRVEVTYASGDRYRIAIRGHELEVDQPLDAGGGDAAPTPTELFVASLASCVAFYAGRYLRRHDLPVEGLRVEVGFTWAEDRPSRVDRIRLGVTLPAGFPGGRRESLLAVIEHCTVHNSIVRTPEIAFELETVREAA